jgi:glycosyltransferase involved in cell wall biosynthesis
MKILQIVQRQQLRGAEIFASQLGNHLLDLGHEVTLMSVFKGDAQLPFKGKLIKLERFDGNRMLDLQGWKKLSDIIEEGQYDVVQANAGDTLKYAAFSKFFFRWKGRLIFRNANKIGDFITSRSKWLFNRLMFTQVDHVISVSDLCKNDLIKTFSWPKENINTVEIGIDMPAFREVSDDVKDILNRGPVIVNVGSLVREKNHEGLLRIFETLRRNLPDVQLIIIGKGNLDNKLREQAVQLGISDSVHFLGYRTDVIDIVHNAQAFALPSLIEGLPAVLLESQYAETPVVAYDVGGISEIIANDSTGYLIGKNDESGFAKALLSALTSDEAKRMVKNARARIIEKFDNRTIAQRFVAVYNKILTRDLA